MSGLIMGVAGACVLHLGAHVDLRGGAVLHGEGVTRVRALRHAWKACRLRQAQGWDAGVTMAVYLAMGEAEEGAAQRRAWGGDATGITHAPSQPAPPSCPAYLQLAVDIVLAELVRVLRLGLAGVFLGKRRPGDASGVCFRGRGERRERAAALRHVSAAAPAEPEDHSGYKACLSEAQELSRRVWGAAEEGWF
jgi:hypothetical protein